VPPLEGWRHIATSLQHGDDQPLGPISAASEQPRHGHGQQGGRGVRERGRAAMSFGIIVKVVSDCSDFDILHEDADLLVVDKPIRVSPTKDGEMSS
jgi:23S rRNA-/tRNA-specific pseudouridylate synthase